MDERDDAWQSQSREAVEGTAGIASYLEEGAEYVEALRRDDAERLSKFEHFPMFKGLRAPY